MGTIVGFGKLESFEQYELESSYPSVARMHDWFKAVQAGEPGLSIDRASIALLWASFRQLQVRVSYGCGAS